MKNKHNLVFPVGSHNQKLRTKASTHSKGDYSDEATRDYKSLAEAGVNKFIKRILFNHQEAVRARLTQELLGFEQLQAILTSKDLTKEFNIEPLKVALEKVKTAESILQSASLKVKIDNRVIVFENRQKENLSFKDILAYFILLFASRVNSSKKDRDFIQELVVIINLLSLTLEKYGQLFYLTRSTAEPLPQEIGKRSLETDRSKTDTPSTLLAMSNFFLHEVFFEEMTKLNW